jgi:hypothetical protein
MQRMGLAQLLSMQGAGQFVDAPMTGDAADCYIRCGAGKKSRQRWRGGAPPNFVPASEWEKLRQAVLSANTLPAIPPILMAGCWRKGSWSCHQQACGRMAPQESPIPFEILLSHWCLIPHISREDGPGPCPKISISCDCCRARLIPSPMSN